MKLQRVFQLSALILGFTTFAAEHSDKWWKGNLHTHTLWSDGDDFPEMVAIWYKERDYNFLAISDHNILLDGEKWVPINSEPRKAAWEKFRQSLGKDALTRTNKGTLEVRLTGLTKIKRDLEEGGRFLMIPSEEISAHHEKLPIHINVSNIRELIRPRGGSNVYEVMQNNINAVHEQRERTGQPMIPHLNHPNFHYAVTAQDLMKVQGERFFEVYNGHPAVYNEGDEDHPSTERIWDIVLAYRLAILKMEPMFGLAVDDSHSYHAMHPKNANPGRGWIMVQAGELTPEALIHAMEDGDFYATSGVRLKSITRQGDELSVVIDQEPGVEYTTRFVGTRTDFAKRGSDGVFEVDDARIGVPLAPEVSGVKATYRLKDNDLYVRAIITSSKQKENGLTPEEMERAWVQPLIPAKYLFLPDHK